MEVLSFKTFLLCEKIDNLFAVDEKEEYADRVWDIIQNSYKACGGIHGSGFRDKTDMMKNIPMWKVFRRGEDIKVVMMYKDKNGRKRVAIGTDGSSEAKAMLAKMLVDEYRTGRAYGEVSDRSLAFIRKQFSDSEFSKFAVPVDKVKEILSDDEIVPVDKYLYKRMIGGEWHEKMMLGNPSAAKIVPKG